jgi:bacteriocin biosynthesis cyclodehydratase domain-containing protein
VPVSVVGADRATAALAAGLAAVGIEPVATEAPELVLWIDDGEGDRFRPDAAGTPVLRVAWDGAHLQLGPQLLGRTTACVDCVRRGLADAGLRAGRVPPDGPAAAHGASPGAAELAAAELVAELVAAELLAVLRRLPTATPARVHRRIRLADRRSESFLVTPYPDCPTCGPWWTDDPLTDAYEWQMERPPPHLLPFFTAVRGSVDRPPGAVADAGRPRHRLTGPAGWPRYPAHGSVVLDEPVLAAVLTRVAGRRDGTDDRRWAPSGGNLGSVLVHVLTERDLVPLPGRTFRYDDRTGELVAAAEPAVPVARLLSGTDLRGAGPVVVVLVADLSRLGRKYGRFAYRLAHLDAGCAITQVAAVAGGYGLGLRLAARWDESVGQLLRLDPVAHVVTAIAVLREGAV